MPCGCGIWSCEAMEWAIGHVDERRVWHAYTHGQEGDRRDDKSSSERQYVSVARSLGAMGEDLRGHLWGGRARQLSLGAGPGPTLCGPGTCPHGAVALLRGEPGRWPAGARHLC